MSEKEELLHRAKSKQKELESKLEQLKADGHEELKAKETEIQNKIENIQSGINQIKDEYTEKVAGKLNQWLS